MTNLVVDPSFTLSSPPNFSSSWTVLNFTCSGNPSRSRTPPNCADADIFFATTYLEQTVTTTTAGNQYTLSFWTDPINIANNNMQIFINGIQIGPNENVTNLNVYSLDVPTEQGSFSYRLFPVNSNGEVGLPFGTRTVTSR
jgi:hypothetical protein